MYFVEAGVVKVTKTNEVREKLKLLKKSYHYFNFDLFIQKNGVQKELNRLTKGSYFGELALITHKPRAASVIAEGDVKVACK